MKIFLILLLWVNPIEDCSGIEEIRQNFHQFETNQELTSYLSLFRRVSCKNSIPYKASAIMQQAEFNINPIKKLRYFNQGKDILENFIKDNPENIEARYVRIQVQFHSPDFLNYNSNINDDILFILRNVSASDLPQQYQKEIIQNIKTIANKL